MQLAEYLAAGSAPGPELATAAPLKNNISTHACAAGPAGHSTGPCKSGRRSRARSRVASISSCGLPMPDSAASTEVDAQEPTGCELATETAAVLCHQQLFSAAPAHAAHGWPTASIPPAQLFGSPEYEPSPRGASARAGPSQGWQLTETSSTTDFQPSELASHTAYDARLPESFPLRPVATGTHMAVWTLGVDPAELASWDALIEAKTPRALMISEGSPTSAPGRHAGVLDVSWAAPEEDMEDDCGPGCNPLPGAWSLVPVRTMEARPCGSSFMT